MFNEDDGVEFREAFISSVSDVVEQVLLMSSVDFDLPDTDFDQIKSETIEATTDAVFEILDDVTISGIEQRVTLISSVVVMSLERNFLMRKLHADRVLL